MVKRTDFGNSLVVQGLGLYACTSGPWIRSLVGGTKIPQATQHAPLPHPHPDPHPRPGQKKQTQTLEPTV